MVGNISIKVTDDYASLIPFFIENELEFTEEDAVEVPTDIIKSWEALNEEGVLVGAAVLARREGEYICDGIATDPSMRSMGLGKILIDKLIEETKSMGGNSIYLVARAPGFFKKIGFQTIKRDNAPNFFECSSCPQYNIKCFPEVMVLTF